MDGRAIWDKKTTEVFLDLCIAEKNKLNFNKKGFTKVGWHNLYREFRKQTGRSYGRKQIQNKFNTLKRQYKSWRKLKEKSGTGWNQKTGTIDCDPELRRERIAENESNKQFHVNAWPYNNELSILFSSMDSKDGKLSCVGGIGDKTPSSGSEDNLDSMSPENVARSEDNAGRSSVGPVSQRPGKEHDVDGAPPKKTKSTECYIEHRSESLIKSIRNERIAMTREQEEVIELLQLVEEDGVPNGSALYFIATELFRSPARRASYRSITAAENRIAWLKWTWENVKT